MERPSVTEATGKKWKGIQLIGVLVLIIGILLALVVAGYGSSGFVYGVAVVPVVGVCIAVYGWLMGRQYHG